MKEKFAKLIDVKSIVTIVFVVTLAIAVIYTLIWKENLFDKVFSLFATVVASVITYFFNKPSNNDKTKTGD